MVLSDNKIFDRPFVLSMGPQRAGTSWLDRYLRARGDVCLPAEVKEIFFFDRHYHRGVDFYRSHFVPQDQHQILMEVSTTSFDVPDAPRHVYETFGQNLTMICPLRHPVARSYSLYLHYKRYGMVSGSLQTACRDNPQIIESSRYADHLERWYEYFDPQSIHFLFQEDLEVDHLAYVSRVCEILQLRDVPLPPYVTGRYNSTTRAPIPALAGFAQRGADFLRENRMYSLINAAKSLGLKPLIFGRGGSGGKDDLEVGRIADIAWLTEQLGAEIVKFEKLTKATPQWHAFDAVA